MIIWCTILTDKKSFHALSRKFTEIQVSQIRLFLLLPYVHLYGTIFLFFVEFSGEH